MRVRGRIDGCRLLFPVLAEGQTFAAHHSSFDALGPANAVDATKGLGKRPCVPGALPLFA
jgi:hypothetical protein